MLSRLSGVYITFDLDSETEVAKKLESIGLSADRDFCSVGVNKPGKDCIEGLLPDEVLSKVYSENVDQVAALGSADSKAKRSAKNNLKRLALQEFKENKLEDPQLVEFKKLLKKISKALAKT